MNNRTIRNVGRVLNDDGEIYII